MALQWIILTYVVAAEAVTAILLTLPAPQLVKSRLVNLVSLILQPCLFIVPFSAFQLMDIYWKKEHRLMCTGETCTASERDRYEKSLYKAQRNVILCAAAVLLYWYTTVFASITRTFRALRRWRRGTKTSSLSCSCATFNLDGELNLLVAL